MPIAAADEGWWASTSRVADSYAVLSSLLGILCQKTQSREGAHTSMQCSGLEVSPLSMREHSLGFPRKR